jgi:hypothetical protein
MLAAEGSLAWGTPAGQAGAQHSQSPITAEGGAVIGYPTPANMAGSRRKSVIWDTIDRRWRAPQQRLAAPHVAASGHPNVVLLDDRDPGVGDDHRRRLAVIPTLIHKA